MLTIVIGCSGSGKTTYVKNHYLTGEFHVVTDIVPCTLVQNGAELLALIGKYGVGIRTEGTDTLSYTALPRIKREIEKLIGKGWHVVIEGDRINNGKFFEWVLMKGIPCELILLTVPLDTALLRLRIAGSHITKTFVMATATKSKHMFLLFGSRMNGKLG